MQTNFNTQLVLRASQRIKPELPCRSFLKALAFWSAAEFHHFFNLNYVISNFFNPSISETVVLLKLLFPLISLLFFSSLYSHQRVFARFLYYRWQFFAIFMVWSLRSAADLAVRGSLHVIFSKLLSFIITLKPKMTCFLTNFDILKFVIF